MSFNLVKGKIVVENFFRERGFEILNLSMPWRNMVGIVEVDGFKYFFKWSGGEEVNEYTKNEYDWYKKMNKRIEVNNVFRVPKIKEKGVLDGRNYFLVEYINGDSLADKYPPRRKGLDELLGEVVNINLWMMQEKGWVTLIDENNFEKEWIKLRDKVKKWKDEVNEDLDEIWKEFLELPNTWKSGLTHGDFVPWHILNQKRELIVIDGEKARGEYERLYDVAYFYQRVFTVLGEDLAKKYLRKVKEGWMFDEDFDSELRPILASRIIGGYWDLKNGDGTKRENHVRLREVFLKNNLI